LKTSLFPLLALLLPAVALAASEPLSEEAYFTEMPKVLTASRIMQSPMDAPAPVTVLDRETIRASGFTEIQDLMRLVPGYLVADWPIRSANVVNHGMGDGRSGRLQVLIDGRSVYNPFNGRVEWDELPIRVHDIERIEVVRTAAPATYGANAFQGVVNIITRAPYQGERISLLLREGDEDMSEYAAIMNGQADRLGWRVSLSRRAVDNFERVYVGEDCPDGAGCAYTPSERMRRDVVNARLDYRLSNSDEIGFQFGYSQGDDRIGEQGSVTGLLNISAYDRETRDLFFRAGWKHAYAQDSEVSLQYYYYGRHAEEDAVGYNGTFLPAEYWVDLGGEDEMKRHDVELQQIHRFSDSLVGMWGLGVRRDQARSDRYLSGLGWQGGTQWQGFANAAWQVTPDWLLNLGGMLEKHYYTDWLFSPRVAANWRVAPNQTLRFSMGRGYRAPTILNAEAREMIYFQDGSLADVELWQYETPDPEEMNFREIGYMAHFPEQNLSIDARIFREDYDNYIDDNSGRLNATRDVFTMRYSNIKIPVPPTVPDVPNLGTYWGRQRNTLFYNMGGARTEGGEIQFDWRHPLLGRFLVSYAAIDVQPDKETELMEQDFASSVSRNNVSLLWSKALTDRLTLNVGHYRVDYLFWLNDGDDQPPYFRTDLKLAWRLGNRGSEDEVALTVQNMGNEYYEFRNEEYLVEERVFLTLRKSW
jgi:iron complex outermembrane receptor protein